MDFIFLNSVITDLTVENLNFKLYVIHYLIYLGLLMPRQERPQNKILPGLISYGLISVLL